MNALSARPFDAISADKVLHQVTRLFAYQKRRLLHELHNRWAAAMTKADDPKKKKPLQPGDPGYAPVTPKQIDDAEISLIIDAMLDEPMTNSFVKEVAKPIAAANGAAATDIINQLTTLSRIARFVMPTAGAGGPRGPFLPPITGGPGAAPERGEWSPHAIQMRTTTRAVDFAASRGAELVGMRFTPNGDLITNPNAQWAINDYTRNTVQGLVKQATELHWSVDKLADRIEESGTFSPERALMIARTEISFAQNAGVLQAGREARAASGVDIRKVWTLGTDPCPLCEDAAAEGAIDLEEDFGDAGEAPPLHPNCYCSLDLFVPEDEEEYEAEEEEKLYNPDQPRD